MYDFEFGSLYELILASANGLNWTEVWSDTEANKFVFAINYQNTTNDFQISVSQPNPPELIPCVVPKDKIKMPNGEINMPTGEPIYTNFPNGITNVKLEFDGVLGFYISKDHGATWTRTLAMTNNTQATLSYQVPGIKF